jgi:hypothetical protein
MPSELPPINSPQSVWQSQQEEGIRMSVEDIRRKAGKFHNRVVSRNVREYAAALMVAVFFGFQWWHTPDLLTRAGFALIIVGVAYVVWYLYQQGSARGVPAEMGLSSGVEFFKRELERQRDLVASVWRWYLGPMMPGWVVLMVALGRRNPGHVQHFALFFAVFNLVAAAFFVFVGWLNQRAAGKLQRKIDELDALAGSRGERGES